MSEPKFTPGPWRLYSRLGVVAVHKDGAAIPVVAWPGFDSAGVGGPHVNEHNARLIAAAPELYEALRGLRNAWCLNACDASSPDAELNHLPECYAARAALAKAVGQ